MVDRYWVTKVTDFGLSRLHASAATASHGTLVATNPRWQAPEVITTQCFGAAADVFRCTRRRAASCAALRRGVRALKLRCVQLWDHPLGADQLGAALGQRDTLPGRRPAAQPAHDALGPPSPQHRSLRRS